MRANLIIPRKLVKITCHSLSHAYSLSKSIIRDNMYVCVCVRNDERAALKVNSFSHGTVFMYVYTWLEQTTGVAWTDPTGPCWLSAIHPTQKLDDRSLSLWNGQSLSRLSKRFWVQKQRSKTLSALQMLFSY